MYTCHYQIIGVPIRINSSRKKGYSDKGFYLFCVCLYISILQVKVSATLTKELAKEIQDCLQVRIQSEFRLLISKATSVYKLF